MTGEQCSNQLGVAVARRAESDNTRQIGRAAAAPAHRMLASRRGLEPLVPWLIAAIASSGLYFGRSVLIPIILAILLSFLLAPIVALLRRGKLPRPAAVLLAVALALAGIGTTSAVILSQAATLSKDAPLYAERVAGKAAKIRAGVQQRFGFLLRESAEGGSGHRNASRARRESVRSLAPVPASGAVPVEVHDAPPTAFEEVQAYVVPALAPIETALVVLIVTVFILFQQEDLRDRLIRLMGAGDLHRTTVALNDGAKRLSRYFLSQFMVNCGFGAVIWGGLFIIGVPSPGLWGILAGLLRFIPYVGTVIAALAPLALAAAVDPGWQMAIWVALLFVLVEPIVGYVVEPMLYGHSTGLSPVSVVVAALFWTWLWGPIGLVLSMPLTLMLVVLGRHVPAFEVFDILLGDRPALSPAQTFYQRVLAGHPDEAIEQAEDLLETRTLATYYDEVVLGGLRLAVADVDRGAVERSALRSVCETTLEVLAALADHRDAGMPDANLSPTTSPHIRSEHGCDDLAGRAVVCFPGRGPLDGAVAAMMTQLLRRAGCQVRELSRDPVQRDGAAPIDIDGVHAVCILGLFDERAFRRLQPLAQRMEQGTTLIGVQRSDEAARANDAAPGLLLSLADFCEAIRAVGK
ncbi:AI-2E family transporter [Sphingomonas sp. GC_Shp_4]|uniref:AI-2E family transporter n=2 Tax=Sphingomonas TaxID=13687 RepID=UPI003211C9CC